MKKWLVILALAVLALLPQLSEACQPYRNVLQDVNGNIIPFGSVTVYKQGTSVAATLYVDNNCTISTVNPTTSTQDGTFVFWTTDGYYDFVLSYPNHTFANPLAVPIFEPVLEKIVPIDKFTHTDLCTPVTGILANVDVSTEVWLQINKPVTCGVSASVPANLILFLTGNGRINFSGGAVLTFSGAVVKKPHYQNISNQLPSVTIDALTASTFELSPPDATAFTINAPVNPSDGQVITINIFNTSGGALGVATWSSAVTGGFKMRAWTQPANGFMRSITFVFIAGYRWYEISRTEADIPA